MAFIGIFFLSIANILNRGLDLELPSSVCIAETQNKKSSEAFLTRNDCKTRQENLSKDKRVPSVSYITSFWAEPPSNNNTHPHRQEIQAALLMNMNNPHFNQVVVILDGVSKDANCSHFLQEMRYLQASLLNTTTIAKKNHDDPLSNVNCVDVTGGQPTYYQMFNYTITEVVTGDVVVLANADHAFDGTISKARYLNPSVLAVLTNHGLSMDADNVKKYYSLVSTIKEGAEKRENFELNRCKKGVPSWDTFIFRPSDIQGPLQEAIFQRTTLKKHQPVEFFYMNEMAAEKAALWSLQQHIPNATLYQACREINSWHFHLAPATHKERKRAYWRSKWGVPGPYIKKDQLLPCKKEMYSRASCKEE